ncbi:19186_t:CDS:2 [Funneliformis geosporum]|uniref:9728_t:CDS:1 n=1 Tax=Funneliformis geosporum TaxID=1117311 RepID=A0A9W4SZ93_9GLOM|nr:19186_t:CDS:2 [Funneliformis geosporum]CAI2186953.1 9728_t:CDS:2 [Funneliformis geosporum]
MSPRTNSPPPSSYGYDDNEYDYHPSGPSTTPPGGHQTPYNNIHQSNLYSSQYHQSNITPNGTNLSRNDVSGTPSTRTISSKDNNDEEGSFTALLLHPLNIPRRVLSSSAVKCVSLMVLYSFCFTTVCFIFFVSYLLTFYDDAWRLFHTSRVWARVRNGVRERISMMGDDWEDFLQKYFDQPWNGDANLNCDVHLGSNNDTSSKRNSNGNGTSTGGGNIPNPDIKDFKWLKGLMLSFMAVVAGQDAKDATNKFQQTANSFRSRPPTTTVGGDSGRR